MGSRTARRRLGDAAAGESRRPLGLGSQDANVARLVIHNELDYRLPISEGLAMFNVLQARGVPSKLLVFPDENHVSRQALA